MSDVTDAIALHAPPAPGVLDDSPADDEEADAGAALVAQYAALETGALLVDHSERDLWLLGGARARATLTGLVTNDVAALDPGQGCYAAALTPKGRVVADVRVFAVGEGAAGPRLPDPAEPGAWLDDVALLVDVPARAAAGWEAVVRKFVNPRVTPYRRVGNAVRAFGVYGPRAAAAAARVFGGGAPEREAALGLLAPYAHERLTVDGAAAVCARVPDAGGPEAGRDGFLFLVPAPAYDAAWARAAAAGAAAGGDAAYTVARVEAGYPEWGLDVDDSTIPQEANLDALGAISYTKGCYTGQEVVARIHFRGHVNRHLRGLAFTLDDGAETAERAALIPAGAALVDEHDKPVGDVRTSARSPRLGGVALGMVRREVPVGAALRARWPERDGGAVRERPVTVTVLPFPR
jgi:folate-binding protein YgfZ